MQRWRKFLKAFFKKIETEGAGNMSLEWLTSAQDVFLAEIERDTSIYPEQKELELLQHEGNSRAEKGVHELESTDGFEMNYEEYKLNEILGTGHTVIETVLLKDSASGGSSSGNKNPKSLNISEMASFHKSSNNTSGTPSWEEDEFKNLSVHIFKFSSTYLEQPRLFYSILLTVPLFLMLDPPEDRKADGDAHILPVEVAEGVRAILQRNLADHP